MSTPMTMQGIFRQRIFQWLLIFISLVIIRGTEGFIEPVSLDNNDLIVFSQIANNPHFPADSIAAQYVKKTESVGITYAPNQFLFDEGVGPKSQFYIFYTLQLALLAFGLLLFFTAFNRSLQYILIAVLIAYLSGFVGFGRYLTLGAGFKIVTSGFALAAGIAILGMHLHGKRMLAAVLAALLCAYHPTHGIVLLSFLGVHALYEVLVARTVTFKQFMVLGVTTALALLPFGFLTLGNIPHGAFDEASWWSYVFSKTSNLTPLQDGAFAVLAILGSVVIGIYVLRLRSRLFPETISVNARCVTILAMVIVLWLIQIIVTEVLPSVSIAQLALTRCTPYAVIILTALLAEAVYRGLDSSAAKDRISGALLALGAFGMALPSRLPFTGFPTIAPAVIKTPLKESFVVEQSMAAILMAGVAWWWASKLKDEAAQAVLLKRMIWFMLAVVLFIGLRTPVLAIGLMLFLCARERYTLSFHWPKPVFISLILVAAAFMLFVRQPWNFELGRDIAALTAMVERNVPKDGMVLTLPFDNDAGEYLLPTRATYLGWGESQYLFYDPPLVSEVWKRARLIGIEPVVDDPACKAWLIKPMCRRALFSERAKMANQSWRKNLQNIKKSAPSLTHVLMPRSMSCPGEKVVGSQGDMVLVPVESVALKACTN